MPSWKLARVEVCVLESKRSLDVRLPSASWALKSTVNAQTESDK